MAVVVCPKSKHCVMLFTPLHFPLSFSLSEGTKHQLSMQRKLKDPPKVTGLSPKEGIPGTKVTIRGENLGTSSKDLIGLTICGVNCLLLAEWISPKKIFCTTTNCKADGPVIVTTKSGGEGTCTVSFRGLQILPNAVKECAIWMDESSLFGHRLNNRTGPSSPMASQREDALGLKVETAVPLSDDELKSLFPEGIHKGLEKHENIVHKDDEMAETVPAEDVQTNPFADDMEDGGNEEEEIAEEDQEQSEEEKLPTLQHLEETLLKSNENAKTIFETVLHRKDRADSTRNALNVLNRFKFLFHLPITMERNIKRGDYEVVINDFERATQLFSASQVPAFIKVYKDVEDRVVKFRDQLTQKLMQLPKSLDDQKRLIRYLIELDAVGDPAWDCIINQQQWIINLLNSCKAEHIVLDKSNIEQDQHMLKVKGHHRRQYSGSGIQIKVSTTDTPSGEGKYNPPQNVAFLEELVELIELSFPDLCKLGQSYFNASIVSEAGGKGMKIDKSKEKVFRIMVTDTIQHFANLVRAAFLPDTLTDLSNEEDRQKLGFWKDTNREGSGAWLPQCVRNVRGILGSLMTLEVPANCLDVLHSLLADLRIHCMDTLFQEATEDIQNLYTRETWVLQMDEHGGISSLPTLFESLVIDTLQHLKEAVTRTKQGELNIFADYDIQRLTVNLASEMIKAFAVCLEQLAFRGEAEADCQKPRLSEVQIPVSLFQPEDSLPSTEQCLVIVLSNNSHVSQHVIPNLMKEFKKHGYPNVQEIENNALEAYVELDEKIFEAYCEQKTEPLVGALEPGMYIGHFEWHNCPIPTGVRPYIKTALMNAVTIHAEINAIAPAFMLRVMTQVLESVSEEMSRLISCAMEGFSQTGALQARLDLAALEEALSPYRNAGTSSNFQEALNSIPKLTHLNDQKLLQKLLAKFQDECGFVRQCFTSDPMSL
ncbi:putative exocyst complex component 2 [Apostichopus japonicus]|uniref:Exocyst complex component 2 n=1 Tax=Stichopus japonicus TaxID=307972 RepID=A0A2G8K299_STIJA|nr:putative exocyst complex component 2 [Apostichopus japonicus]